MTIRSATALWKGTLKEGEGRFFTESKLIEAPYTFASRFETKPGTNPEELAGAAHAACYSMFLSALLSGAKFVPTSIETTSAVTLERDEIGPKITRIHLSCKAIVPGLSEAELQTFAAQAKEKCPISRLYAGTDILLSATLG